MTMTAQQRWRLRNPEQYRIAVRKSKVKIKFGLSWDEYLALEAARGKVCWICGTDEPGRGRTSMCVDHDHETGKVRGLLCFDCNNGIGLFGDDPALIAAAIEYLTGADS